MEGPVFEKDPKDTFWIRTIGSTLLATAGVFLLDIYREYLYFSKITTATQGQKLTLALKYVNSNHSVYIALTALAFFAVFLYIFSQ